MKKLITAILIMLSPIAMYAQKNDVGIFAGSSYYTGDLNPGTPFKNTLPAIGAFYRHNFTNRLAIRAGYTTTTLKGNDFQNRSFSFKTNLNEVSAQLEVNFYEFGIDREDNLLTPYIFGGMGNSWFKVKEFSGTKVKSPITQRITNFPLGIGIKYNPIENVSVGLEWGLRKTTGVYADKIDFVYQPGDRISDATDWYAFAGLCISIRLNFFQSDRCEELWRH